MAGKTKKESPVNRLEQVTLLTDRHISLCLS
jgi:hypothetical protein